MYAQWQIQHTVTFDSQGGSEVSAITANEGAEVGKPTDPTRNGYTFVEWSDGASGGTACVWPHTLTADVTMYAQWQAVTYNITYTLNGGSDPGNPGTYTVESAAITLNEPSRKGYRFAGWHDNPEFEGSPVTVIPAGSTEDKDLHARWTAITGEGDIAISFEALADVGIALETFTVYQTDHGDAVTYPPSKTVTVTHMGEYTSFRWYLDNSSTSRSSNNAVTVTATALSVARHTLTVEVDKDGRRYSRTINFLVSR
jgi:uncharacterized repeat protein (TIGR02543 family)